MTPLTRIPSLKSPQAFRTHLASLGVSIPCDDALVSGPASPLLQPLPWRGRTLANRWAIHPMEGWDGTESGNVTETLLRRWRRFGESGASLIWGGEAMAVQPDGRANPRQLILAPDNQDGLRRCRDALLEAHQAAFPGQPAPVIGFQLTHSGRFSRPGSSQGLTPRVAFRHPLLDEKWRVTSDAHVLTDDDVDQLIADFIRAGQLAAACGADFVDIKHCHGYLLHEFLGAHTRPGRFGGSFENRTRILRDIAAGLRAACPQLEIGVRLSAFDFVPFQPDPSRAEPGKLGPGIPVPFDHALPYRFAFGVNPDRPTEYDLTEPRRFLEALPAWGISLVNLSAGSPYYNPHIQRPAAYPPSDGYQPPEDPLIGVARQMNVVRELKQHAPALLFVGSGYSYLQDFLPHVAQAALREGWVDVVGLGRMVLSYPGLLADASRGVALQTRHICRTLSDCTTAPRNGLRSGCYPLDDFYKSFEDAPALKAAKARLAAAKA